jgi:malate synthase
VKKTSAGAIETGSAILGARHERFDQILTRGALDFVLGLECSFGARRRELLTLRQNRQARLDSGEFPDFILDTAGIRNADWKVAHVPADLLDRRVEITGPVDRKMIINALNSGASVFMADFEDSTTPTWNNLIEDQRNLHDAVRRTITYSDPKTEKSYTLNDETAVLFVRPSGWHLPEAHLTVDGTPISATLFDFGLFLGTTPRSSWPEALAPISISQNSKTT